MLENDVKPGQMFLAEAEAKILASRPWKAKRLAWSLGKANVWRRGPARPKLWPRDRCQGQKFEIVAEAEGNFNRLRPKSRPKFRPKGQTCAFEANVKSKVWPQRQARPKLWPRGQPMLKVYGWSVASGQSWGQNFGFETRLASDLNIPDTR